MELHVEDEEGITRPLAEGRGVCRLDGQDVEEAAEDRVHGEERRGDAAAAPQELTPAQPEPRRQTARLGEDSVLDLALRRRLRQRRELLVGDEACGERNLGTVPAPHSCMD